MTQAIFGKEFMVGIGTVHVTLYITSDNAIALAEFTRAQTCPFAEFRGKIQRIGVTGAFSNSLNRQ